ncbi:MAG: hypothetical protein JSV52_06910 [Candidatus Zixiibacteriota bacterium]|nr:MAG: hypothetical protein JSV52_06910 [candidate division Zixibacteria bacterium]
MKYTRIIIALILTIAMLVIARNNSRGRPEYYSHQENGYTFEYWSVPKALEFTNATIPLTIKGDFSNNIQPTFRRSAEGADIARLDGYESHPMTACDSAADCFQIGVTAGEKNGRFYYYFEVLDSSGAVLATFADSDGSPFMFRYIGAVPNIITVTHIALIFATVFFVALGTIHSIGLVNGGTNVKPLAIYSFLAAACAFLGGYPFGIPMNWYAFGGLWEGVPFGSDATDNKTQLLFVYLLFVTLATFGSLRGKSAKDIFSAKTSGWFGIGSFAVMLFIYLIPHSIQFSSGLTYAFCYSFIGIVVLIYLVGRIRRARA